MKNQQDIASYDHELKQMITSESQRQEEHIELIASENYASGRVMEAQGSCLTNKYAEGYPSKRYYGGCEYVDQVEVLAQERAKAIFGADYANVQPHSGSQANMAVYFSLLKVGDTILGMNLNEGGHLTHGSDVNVSGRAFHAVAYGLNADGDIDYDQVEALAKEHQPKLIIAGFSAFSGVADWQRFRQIADQVGAYLLADIAHVAGLIVAGLYPSPLPHAHVVTSTTHKTLRGPRGGIILSKGQPDIEKKLNFGIFPMSQGGPLMHIIAAKAVAFKEAMEADFKVYQQQVLTNAKAMVKVLMSRGYTIVSQGTSNHMFLIDLINHPLNGKEAEHILSQVNITTNKNGVPNDPLPPFVSSGVRIGTPAITTRGFKEAEAQQVATWIADVLDNPTQDLSAIKASVSALCQRFPVYTQ